MTTPEQPETEPEVRAAPTVGNRLPEIGSPSILPIVPGGGNKLPEIGEPTVLPIVPESGT